jgi:26S proteasome regulatory subunit N1
MAGKGEEEAKSNASAIEVNSTDKKSGDSTGAGKKSNNNGKDGKEKEELSEEDIALKEGLELAVSRLKESDPEIHKQALQHLTNEIRSSTSSMTSVPKPLKFLRPHYQTLKDVYSSWSDTHALKTTMADVLSVLAMTMQPVGSRECLKFKLSGTVVNVSSWGHEYVRSLAGEISEEYNFRSLQLDNREEQEDDGDEEPVLQVEDLMTLVDDIVPFQMKHNAEAEAVDLLLEVKQLGKLLALTATANGETSSVVDGRNYERVCLYLLRTTSFIVDPEDLSTIYHTAYSIYKEQKKLSDALRVAVKIDDPELIDALFAASTSAAEKKQMALILARQRSYYRVSSVDPDSAECEAEAEALNELVGNSGLSERFLAIAREMNITVPKLPEDIYKSSAAGALTHAQTLLGRSNAAANFAVDSARANLAATFVNAFVNAAYCKDKLIIDPEGQDGAGNINSWLFKNKGHGMMSAAASLGMLMLWNVDEGLNQIDKYFHNSEDFVKAGACLGVGILSSGVRNEAEPALALLSDALSAANASTAVKTASICGLGIAYAGARNEDVRNLLEGVLSNDSGSTDYITEASMAALALGFAYVGTCDDDISSGILTRMMESSEADLNHTSTRFMCLGLGLLYLGKGDRVEPVLEAVKTIEHRRGKYCEATLETCAYAGTGNVLKVQQMLRLCTEHITDSAAAEHQAVAVLGIALVTGESLSLHTYIHPSHKHMH